MAYTPQNHPPIDPNVPLPPAVKAAAERAEAIQRAAYNAPAEPAPAPTPAPFTPPTPEPAPQPVTVTDASAPQPAPKPAPQPVTAPVTPAPASQPAPAPEPAPKPVDWEARFKAMEGRYKQTQQALIDTQGQLSAMGDELQSRMQAPPAPVTPQPVPTITEEDRKTYGEDLLGVVERVARGVAMQAVTPLEQRTNRVVHQVQQTMSNSVLTVLDSEMPDWRAINTSPRFKAWLALRDVYSGGVRQGLLMDAFRRGDTPRVLAFFRGFVADEQATGQMPAPEPSPQPTPAPANATVPLIALSTPGRPHPAGDANASADGKPVFTRADIRWFYSNEGVAAYYGRPDARKADEQRIFEAQREGRVR